MQAGTSSAGRSFAAKHAEAIFVSGHSPASVAASVASIRAQAAEYGRDPASIKFLAKITTVLGRTHEEAQDKYAEYMRYGSYEGALALFGGWTGVDMAQYGDDEELNLVESNAIRSYIEGLMKHAPTGGKKWTKKVLAEHIMVGGLGTCAVGTPWEVADEMERWVQEAGVDGFNMVSCVLLVLRAVCHAGSRKIGGIPTPILPIPFPSCKITLTSQCYAILPRSFEDVIDLLIPELQKRGLFWTDFAVPGGTYRENLTGVRGQSEPEPSHPAHGYIWRASEDKEEVGLSLVGRMRNEHGKGGGDGDDGGNMIEGVDGVKAPSSTASMISHETMRLLEDRYATALS